MTTATLESPFGVDLMVPAGDIVNGKSGGKTGYTTTYVKDELQMASTQKKDDDED